MRWLLFVATVTLIVTGRAVLSVVEFEPPPPQSALPLVQPQDLTYVCTFRAPAPTTVANLNYGGGPIAFWPGRESLIVGTPIDIGRVAEIGIPATCGTSSSLSGLARASWRQVPSDILRGKKTTIDGDIQNGVKLGGFLIDGDRIIVTAWSYYDAGPTKQTRTHFVTGKDFATLTASDVLGPFQVGTGFQNIVPTDTSRIGGFVSGYMTSIPGSFQALLGGTHLTGQGGGVSITVRTSSGPSASVFSPQDLGATVPALAKIVMGYPSNTSDPKSILNQPTLGTWGIGDRLRLYDGTQFFRGMVFPDGTRSVLFFGWGGLVGQFCYGAGTANPTLHFKPNPQGGHWCYDPVKFDKGTHGYPYRSLIYAYDANDFVAVKNGLKKPWEVVPYTTWALPTLPFQQQMKDLGFGLVDVGLRDIIGAAFDPATGRLFLSSYRGDANAPLFHVFKLALTPLSPVDAVCRPDAWSSWSIVNGQEQRTRQITTVTPSQNGGKDCPASETETRPLLVAPTVTLAAATCALDPAQIAAPPPDGSGGWTVSYALNGATFVAEIRVSLGDHALVATWTKSGEVRVSPATTVTCR